MKHHPDENPDADLKRVPLHAQGAQRVRVLIVDDSPLVCASLTATLGAAGYETQAVHDGAAALRLIEASPFDVVITDLRMPVMDGFALLDAVKARDPDIEVLVITGEYADDSDSIVRALRLGANDFIGKSACGTDQILWSMGRALERRRHREQLRAAEARYHESEAQNRKVLDHVHAIVWSADGESLRFNLVSSEAERLLGYPRSAWREDGFWLDHVHSEDRERVLAHCRAAVSPPFRYQECDFRMWAADGRSLWIKDRVHAVAEARGSVELIGVMTDVSRQHLLEEELRQAQRMEAFGQLAGGMAHDFNNILGVIMGFSDLLLEELPPEDPRHERVARIQAAAHSGAGLTRQLLTFSRKQVLNPRNLDLGTVVAAVEPMLRRVIHENIQILIVSEEGLPRVEADYSQVEQLIMNLVINARDAMPDGGKLLIETASVALDETYSRFHPEVQPGSYVSLAVSDTGIGMDASTQARIFEPFFTTKAPDKGTGLGLATVFGIVKQNNGHIVVYSEPGRGSTFRIYLPQIAGPAEPVSVLPARVSVDLESATTGTIMVVEDDASLREITAEILQQAGYTVLESTGVERSLTFLKAARRVDLLLTDIIMPGTSGPELAKQVLALSPTTRVLFMSGYPREIVDHHHLVGPDTPFIQKPLTRVALLAAVREALNPTPPRAPGSPARRPGSKPRSPRRS